MASGTKQRPFGGNQRLTLAFRKKKGSLSVPRECSDSPEAGVGLLSLNFRAASARQLGSLRWAAGVAND